VARTRTVMVTVPAVLRDLIKQLASGRVELDLVAELNFRPSLVRRLKAIRPDLVIIGLRRGETDAVVIDLLRLLPTTKFIAHFDNGPILGLEFRLHRAEIGDAPTTALIDFIAAGTNEHSR
jgi:hypothetical protein